MRDTWNTVTYYRKEKKVVYLPKVDLNIYSYNVDPPAKTYAST